MIVRPRPTAIGLLFTLRGSIIPMVAPRVLVVLAVSAIVALVNHEAPHRLPELPPTPFTLLGLALSIFLGFRNNACYDRWWEARRQWGQLIAEARIMMRDADMFLPDDAALRSRVANRIIAFAHALRDQLRGAETSGLRERITETEWPRVASARSRPDAILLAQAAEIRALRQGGLITDIAAQVLSDRLWAMTTIQTACERLRATPTPFTYSLLLHRTAWLFCLLLPFSLVRSLDFGAPIATAVLAYAFFGLDALGDELEAPFSTAPNAIPLDAMVRAIEIAVLEAAGAHDLPAPLQPRDFLLL